MKAKEPSFDFNRSKNTPLLILSLRQAIINVSLFFRKI